MTLLWVHSWVSQPSGLVWLQTDSCEARRKRRILHKNKDRRAHPKIRNETHICSGALLGWADGFMSVFSVLSWKRSCETVLWEKKAYFQEKSLNLFQDEADPTGATLQITMTRISSPNLITSRIQITWCRFTSTNRSLPTSATSSVCDTALIHCL